MAYLVENYVGMGRRSRRPYGFTSRERAVEFMVEVAFDAVHDGLRVDGDPRSGTFSVHDDAAGPEEFETYVLSETSDPKRLRKAVAQG